MSSVDWYGLGVFGLPIASRLVSAGHSVRAGNERGRVPEFVRAGGLSAGAQSSDAPLVGLCLPTGADVIDVVRDIQEATFVVDFSSHDPLSATEAAGELASRGIGYVDCPVSGSVQLAADGRLTGYPGASPATLPEEVRELIGTVCGQVFWTGGPGQGQAMKLVNQVIHLGNVLVLGEGFELAGQLGLEPATVLEALKASSGSSRMLERFGEQMLAGRYPRQFSARLARKDIRSVLTLAPDLPVAGMVEERLRNVVESGHGEDNFTRLARREQV